MNIKKQLKRDTHIEEIPQQIQVPPIDLDKIILEANSIPKERILGMSKPILPKEEIGKIISILATEKNAKQGEILGAIYLLFLKGASSAGTPYSLSVDLPISGGKLTKGELEKSYNFITKNNHIRRLAEALAQQIGSFAMEKGLLGELAIKINRDLMEIDPENPLSKTEMAWCSSFSQVIPDLAQIASPRLVKLLAQDYNKRFTIKTNKKSENSKRTTEKNKKSQKKIT